MLRNRLSGADFHEVRQHGFDRILEFEFRREDQDTTIVVELFGDGNVAVLDQNGEVVDCLETVRLKSRTVAAGAQYGFPSARVNPIDLDYEAFAAKMRQSDTDLVRTLATQLNFGGLYAEELCTRADVRRRRTSTTPATRRSARSTTRARASSKASAPANSTRGYFRTRGRTK